VFRDFGVVCTTKRVHSPASEEIINSLERSMVRRWMDIVSCCVFAVELVSSKLEKIRKLWLVEPGCGFNDIGKNILFFINMIDCTADSCSLCTVYSSGGCTSGVRLESSHYFAETTLQTLAFPVIGLSRMPYNNSGRV